MSVLKRKISMVLAVALTLTILSFEMIDVKAITPSGVKNQMDLLMTQYPAGDSNPQKNCWHFINMMSKNIFGHGLPNQSTDEKYKYYFTDSYKTNFIQVEESLTIKDGTLTENSLKSLFQHSQPGDVIQMDYTTWKGADSLHVMMVYSASSSGVVFYHAGSKIYFGAGNGKDKLNKGTTGTELTWSQLKGYFYSHDDGISLYRSKAVNEKKQGNTENTFKRPDKVIIKKVKSIGNDTIKITWKKAKNAQKYQVYRAISKNGVYKLVKTTKATKFKNTGLKSNKKYYYKIRAVNGKKRGDFSKKKCAKTKNGIDFNNTYWFLGFGQSLGTHYIARFQPNGTILAFHMGSQTFITGTYKCSGDRLVVKLEWQGRITFEKDGNNFRSIKKYPMQVGEDYYSITPTDGTLFMKEYNKAN